MRYRSAAFALKSAHALAGPGSTHFPARGVDADALLSPAAVLYLLRFSGDIVTAEQTFVTGVVPPVRVVAAEILVTLAEVVRVHKNFGSLVLFAKVAREVLSDGTGLTLACVLHFEALNDAMCEDASVWCLATKQLDAGKSGNTSQKRRPPSAPSTKP